jgi:hypothetical protein
MNIDELESRLAAAKSRYKAAVRGGGRSEWRAAHDDLLQAERELSLAKGKETALECDWPILWSKGAPLPHVVSSGYRTFLMYLASEPDPNWDGTYITVVDPSSSGDLPIALVEFVDCYIYKFGGPNDEVFRGQPLSGRGLGGYSAHIVANSRWLAELQRINSVHSNYDPSSWRDDKHYLLLFHDEIFECIATDYKIELIHGTFRQAMEIATARLFER